MKKEDKKPHILIAEIEAHEFGDFLTSHCEYINFSIDSSNRFLELRLLDIQSKINKIQKAIVHVNKMKESNPHERIFILLTEDEESLFEMFWFQEDVIEHLKILLEEVYIDDFIKNGNQIDLNGLIRDWTSNRFCLEFIQKVILPKKIEEYNDQYLSDPWSVNFEIKINVNDYLDKKLTKKDLELISEDMDHFNKLLDCSRDESFGDFSFDGEYLILEDEIELIDQYGTENDISPLDPNHKSELRSLAINNVVEYIQDSRLEFLLSDLDVDLSKDVVFSDFYHPNTDKFIDQSEAHHLNKRNDSERENKQE